MLFVFPGIEQHNHTPEKMSRQQAQQQTTAPPGALQATQDFQSPSRGSWVERAQKGSTVFFLSFSFLFFFFLRQDLTLSSQPECSGANMAQCSLNLQVQAILPP